MSNTRGNKYSNKHVKFDPENDWEYWENSISTDIAKYDIPAFMKYILKEANVDDITIIGHS